MDVTFTEDCREILSRLELPEERVVSVFNNRTRGMLVPGDPARIYGVSWFDQGQIIFASGTVTASRQEQKRFYIDEVSAHLGLELRQNLPAGRISPELKMERITVAHCREFWDTRPVPPRSPTNGPLQRQVGWQKRVGYSGVS